MVPPACPRPASWRRLARGRLARAARLSLLAALLGTTAQAAPVEPERWLVSRPGTVLVDVAKRAGELQRIDPAERERLCPPPPADAADPEPVQRLAGPATASGADAAAQPFALAVMAGAAAALAGDRGAGDAATAVLARWARADALNEMIDVGPDRNNANALYALKRALLGVLPAWAVLRRDATPEARAEIDGWLARRVQDADQATGALAGRPSESSATNRNHQRLMREAVVMAHGALTADADKLKRGARAYLAALKEMRPDGSLPVETARGARALWYQRHAVAVLVFMAELAQAQGYDLYGAEVEGKRLGRAVDFLLREIAEPSRVVAYAAERQDLGFLETRPSGRNSMAWLEPWLRRTPPGVLATGDVIPTTLAHRPLLDEIAGGNLTCFFAKLG